MYIGGETVIPDENIICIIDKETTLFSRDTRRAIDAAIGTGRLDTRAGDAQRSYIIVEREGRYNVCASPIGSERLYSRHKLFEESIE